MAVRCILHVDMDAFFTSVEVLDNPALRGQPVLVGGHAARGVVAAASYEARTFGVHSAMPMATALRLCPQAVVLHGRRARYQDVSQSIMALLGGYSPLLEQVSVDEAYLDLTHWRPAGRTTEQLAREIQLRISDETGLSCSIGVATGKAIAKMASDLRKPHGLVLVPPGEEASFLAPLPIASLRGVGAATERKLSAWGIATIGDLTRLPESLLTKRLGVAGRELLRLAQGHDDSPVQPLRPTKSIGRETTFQFDIQDRAQIERTLLALADDVSQSLRRHALLARGVTLKVRFDDFTTFTRSITLAEPVDVTAVLYQHALALFASARISRPLRLLGVTASPLLPAGERQLSLFADASAGKDARLDAALDAVHARFGDSALQRARLVKPSNIEGISE